LAARKGMPDPNGPVHVASPAAKDALGCANTESALTPGRVRDGRGLGCVQRRERPFAPAEYVPVELTHRTPPVEALSGEVPLVVGTFDCSWDQIDNDANCASDLLPPPRNRLRAPSAATGPSLEEWIVETERDAHTSGHRPARARDTGMRFACLITDSSDSLVQSAPAWLGEAVALAQRTSCDKPRHWCVDSGSGRNREGG
jgi:hypothetical protein